MYKEYLDAIPPESGREYNIATLPNGNVTITDVTEYVQEGTPFGASDVYATSFVTYLQNGNSLMGAGSLGKFVAISDASYEVFLVNDIEYSVLCGSRKVISLHAGELYQFTLNTETRIIEFIVGAGSELLWSNPDLEVPFPNQTIPLVCRAYSTLTIPCIIIRDGGVVVETFTVSNTVGEYQSLGVSTYNLQISTKYDGTRFVFVYANGIYFSNAFVGINGAAPTQNDDLIVPVQIWGNI